MKLNQTKPTRPSGGHPEPTEAEIQKAAYYLWQEKGCPDRNDLDNWLEARELLRHRAPLDSGAPPGTHSVQERSGSPARGAARPATVQVPAIHFPVPHSTAPFPPAGPVAASAHLDFRHSSPPFKPGNPPLRNP